MIRFLVFQEYVATALLCMNDVSIAEDGGSLGDVINKVYNVEPPARMPKEMGETYARAKILYIVAKGVSQTFYKTLSSENRGKLHSLFRDSLEEEQVVMGRSWREIVRNHQPKFQELKDYAKGIKPFLKACRKRDTFANPLGLCLQEIEPTDKRFAKMSDVNMDTYEMGSFSRRINIKSKMPLIGTSKLACCVAIVVIGRDKTGKIFYNLGHYPSPTEADIEQQADDLFAKGVPRDQMVEVAVGGCLQSFPDILQLVMARGPRMMLLNCGTANLAILESTAVVLDLDRNGRPILYYAIESDDPVVAQLQSEWWESGDEAEEGPSAGARAGSGSGAGAGSSRSESKRDKRAAAVMDENDDDEVMAPAAQSFTKTMSSLATASRTPGPGPQPAPAPGPIAAARAPAQPASFDASPFQFSAPAPQLPSPFQLPAAAQPAAFHAGPFQFSAPAPQLPSPFQLPAAARQPVFSASPFGLPVSTSPAGSLVPGAGAEEGIVRPVAYLS